MCVIVFKPKNIKLPSKENLKSCWTNNPDGAGYCYFKDKKVHIKKGFMKFDDFYKSLSLWTLENNVIDHDLLLHFRITSSGKTTQHNTHPFIIGDDSDKLEVTTDRGALCHNGTIFWTNYDKNDDSDTLVFSRDFINAINLYHDGATKIIEKATSSKIAIMRDDGAVLLCGAFIQDKNNKCHYSNKNHDFKVYYRRFQPLKTKKVDGCNFKYFDDDNDNDDYDNDYKYDYFDSFIEDRIIFNYIAYEDGQKLETWELNELNKELKEEYKLREIKRVVDIDYKGGYFKEYRYDYGY